MSVPVWVLLGFAAWTLLVLFGTVGVYRWSRILTGRREIRTFTPDVSPDSGWYGRAMRAHVNCIENLPVYGAIVVASLAAGVSNRALDILAVVLLVARMAQTTVHVACEPTNAATSVRFGFFLIQALCMVAMGTIIAIRA